MESVTQEDVQQLQGLASRLEAGAWQVLERYIELNNRGRGFDRYNRWDRSDFERVFFDATNKLVFYYEDYLREDPKGFLELDPALLWHASAWEPLEAEARKREAHVEAKRAGVEEAERQRELNELQRLLAKYPHARRLKKGK